jgi:hypothetical protein
MGLLLAFCAWNAAILVPVLRGAIYQGFPIIARYGGGYAAAMAGADSQDHSWKAYESIRTRYGGWELIGNDDAVLFSAMYAMSYTGPAATRIEKTDVLIGDDEARALLLLPHLSVDLPRAGGLDVLDPPAGDPPGRAVMLVAPSGRHVLAPVSLAPARFRSARHRG